jgi:hypothetical protein
VSAAFSGWCSRWFGQIAGTSQQGHVVIAALVVLLGLSTPLRAPDLQVEAVTTAGADLPELADAVARALVAGGARVVLRGPSSGSCLYCAKVAVVEAEQGSCRVQVDQEVKQERHTAAATLHLPADSPLFDRARAIAIQARLLVTWETSPDPRAKEAVTRSVARKVERKIPDVDSDSESWVASAGPSPIAEAELVSGPQAEPVPVRPPDPVVASDRRVDAALVAPVTYVERTGAKPADRAESMKLETARPRPEGALSAKVASASLEPTRRRWPWIPTIVGSGAAVVAGLCAVVARDRYNALADRSQTLQSAQASKSEGQKWQVASFVLSGVAVAGLTTGVWGFVGRSPERSSVALVATPVHGGGMLAVAGDLP